MRATGQRLDSGSCMWCRAARCTFSPTGHFHFARWARPRLIGCARPPRAASGSLGRAPSLSLSPGPARRCVYPYSHQRVWCTAARGGRRKQRHGKKKQQHNSRGGSVLSGRAWAAAACRSGPPQCLGRGVGAAQWRATEGPAVWVGGGCCGSAVLRVF